MHQDWMGQVWFQGNNKRQVQIVIISIKLSMHGNGAS